MALRTALVTGASSGLGREIARQLVVERGMTVLATARRADRLEALAAELPPGKVLIEAGDIADSSFRQRLWSRGASLPGGIGLLVNNAGVGHYAEFHLQDPDAAKRIMEVNVVALMDLTRLALGPMIARGSGQVLQISSVLGEIGLPYSSAYVASKHAVNGLVKSLRYELRGTGVRVWAACPGRTVSEFAAVAFDDPTAKGPLPQGEPTEKVVRSIIRQLDGRKAFFFPTAKAWAPVALSRWLPGPFDWVMDRWSSGVVKKEWERARGPASPSAP